MSHVTVVSPRSQNGRLTHGLRAGDTLARTGGAEFVILCEDLPAEGAEALLENVAGRVRAVLARTGRVGPVDLAVHASVGVALADPDEDDPEAVIAAADEAVYRAKRSAGPAVPGSSGPARPASRPSLWVLSTDRNGWRVLRLRGELDLASADSLTSVLDDLAEAGRPAVVDLSGLTFADYTGLSVLGAVRRGPDGAPHRVAVIGASPLLVRVLTLGGLGHLLSRTDPSSAPAT